MNNTQEINSLAEAIEYCKMVGVPFDMVYYHPVEGFKSDSAPVHYYFNRGSFNLACYTPSLRALTIFGVPRQDALLGEIVKIAF